MVESWSEKRKQTIKDDSKGADAKIGARGHARVRKDQQKSVKIGSKKRSAAKESADYSSQTRSSSSEPSSSICLATFNLWSKA